MSDYDLDVDNLIQRLLEGRIERFTSRLIYLFVNESFTNTLCIESRITLTLKHVLIFYFCFGLDLFSEQR